MIAVGTIIVIALIWTAFRRGAWLVAFLGIAAGITLTGPMATVVRAVIDATADLTNALNKLT